MGSINLAVVIPAYNEEATIGRVVGSLINNFTVLVVDDGSCDRTGEIARICGAEVFTIDNSGYEKALMFGLRKAELKGYNFALTIDADNQFPETEINKLIHLANDQLFVAVGCRIVLQRWSEEICSSTYRFFYGIKDPISGLKLYNLKLLNLTKQKKPLIGTYGLYALTIIAKSNIHGVKCVDVVTRPRSDMSRVGSGFLINLKIIIGMIYSMIFAKKLR